MSERTTQSDTPPSRREFLLVSGTAVSASWSYAAELEALIRPPTFVARVRRDRDLLQLELAFIGFREKDGWLVASPGNRSLVAVHFPPQNLAEALFDRKEDPNAEHQPLPISGGANSNSPEPPIRSYLSGPSRIVFEAPAGARFQVRCPTGKKRNRSIVDEWLAELAGWKLHIPPEAGQPRFAPRLPRLDETCLEIPYRVMLSPRSAEARWLTPSDRMPFDESRAGVSELWNAELMSRKPLLPAKPGEDLGALDPNLAPLADVSLQATAVCSPDHRKVGEPGAGEYYPGNQELSLLSLTRHRLVHQMSGLSDTKKENGPAGGGWVDIDHLVLSALGATGFLAYFNPKSFATIIAGQIAEFQKNKLGPPPPETVSSELMVWKHRMVVGRDVYFVEAYFGVLFPMVYPCIFVKLTERQFASRVVKEPVTEGPHKTPTIVGPPGAYLLTRRYIVVRENERNFTDSDTPLGRCMPMKSVALGWTQTPDLQDPDTFPIDKDLQTPNSYAPGATKPLVFVPRPINGPKTSEALRWPVTMTDESGRQAKTDDACLLFANHVILGHQAWEGLQHKFREWSLPPQPVALAPETPYLTDPTGRHHDLQNAERDGAGRLGEAVRTWQAVAGDEFQSRFDRLLRGRDLRPLLPALATLEAVERELRPVWKELPNSAPLAKLLRDEFLKAGMFGGDADAAVGAFLAKHRPHIEGNTEEIRSRIRRGSEQVLASMNRLEQSTLDTLRRHLAVVNTPEMLREVHAQLGRAEKIASLLETHAVVFGSRLVDSLYSGAAEGLVSRLKAKWEEVKDGPKFVEGALAILQSVTKPEYAKLAAAMRA